jgi:hypothetical protein
MICGATPGSLFSFSLALSASSLLLACQTQLKNTEGDVFDISCAASNCTLQLVSEQKAKPKDKKPARYVVRNEGRILTACPPDSQDFDCRPLRCETGSGCSQIGGAAFGCQKGICQAPERKITPEDRTALCLAETGQWKREPLQLERMTLARACRGDCEVPAACLNY